MSMSEETQLFILPEISPVSIEGKVIEVTGTRLVVKIEGLAIGDFVSIELKGTAIPRLLFAEITGFDPAGVTVTPYGDISGVRPGTTVRSVDARRRINNSYQLLGKVVNGLGSEGEVSSTRNLVQERSLESIPSLSDTLAPTKQFKTGVAVIDLFLPLVCGQRIGIYAEPGVGKSSLLRSINRNANCDIFIFALIGERRREVVEFVDELKKSERFSNSIVVQATSDQPAIIRMKAAETAFRLADEFRRDGKSVLLAIDSATRLFRAYREVGLACGEMPVRKGYPPSAFARLPTLVERAGVTKDGSITALFTVLLSDDIEQDPMIEELKSLTDGHIVLSSKIAQKNIYPAIDILQSISRLEKRAVSKEIYGLTKTIRKILAEEREFADIASLRGSLDQYESERRLFIAQLEELLTQGESEVTSLEELISTLKIKLDLLKTKQPDDLAQRVHPSSEVDLPRPRAGLFSDRSRGGDICSETNRDIQSRCLGKTV